MLPAAPMIDGTVDGWTQQMHVASRLVLSYTMLAASIGKARNFHSVVATIRQMPMLGGPSVVPVTAFAGTLIAGEAFLGCWLLSDVHTVTALVVSLIVLASFTGYLAYHAVTGNASGCACFGKGREQVGAAQFIRNGVLLLAASYGLATALPGSRPAPLPIWAYSPVHLGTALVIALSLTALYLLSLSAQSLFQMSDTI